MAAIFIKPQLALTTLALEAVMDADTEGDVPEADAEEDTVLAVLSTESVTTDSETSDFISVGATVAVLKFR